MTDLLPYDKGAGKLETWILFRVGFKVDFERHYQMFWIQHKIVNLDLNLMSFGGRLSDFFPKFPRPVITNFLQKQAGWLAKIRFAVLSTSFSRKLKILSS